MIGIIKNVDCKTVRISVHSSTREQSNKRSGTRLKTESETGQRHFFLSPYGRVRPVALRARKTLTSRVTDFLLIPIKIHENFLCCMSPVLFYLWCAVSILGLTKTRKNLAETAKINCRNTQGSKVRSSKHKYTD